MIKKHIHKLLIIIALLGTFVTANATHLIGGYMSYEYLGRNADGDYDYKVTLHIFRDLVQSNVDFDEQIELGVYINNNTLQLNKPWIINLIFRRKVNPPGSTDCDYYLDNVKIEEGFYEAVISLPSNSTGYHLTFVRCCRNNQDNLQNQSGQPFQGQTYYCFIPNPLVENSSPFFSGVPSPYMCAKDTNVFLNRAIDPDGDSLVYRFVWPFQGGSPTQGGAQPTPPSNLNLPIDSVQYQTGYNYMRPFGAGGYIDIDASNGLTTLYSPKTGHYVVAIEVLEYRDGVFLSRVRLDMQILVLDCPPNEQPKVNVPGGYYYEVEAGDKLCFDVEGVDIDGDNVTIEGEGDIFTGKNGFKPPLATLDPTAGNGSVKSTFCWTPSCDQAKNVPYEFTVIVTDDGCPPKNDKKNVQILVKKFIGSDAIIGPGKVCSGANDLYEYQASNPKVGSSFYWDVSEGEIVGLNNAARVFINWNGNVNSGKLRMVEISKFGCPGDTVSIDVELLKSPSPPTITGPDTVCLGSTGNPYSVPLNAGSNYEWITKGGLIESSTANNAVLTWNSLGDQYIACREQGTNGCWSDTFFFPVNVRKPLPIVVGPNSICPNASGIAYKALGGLNSTYNWLISGGVQASGTNTDNITVNWGDIGTGNIRIIETDKFGCTSVPVDFAIDKNHNLKGQLPIGDNRVCDNDLFQNYYVLPSLGSSYTWTIDNGTQLNGDSSASIDVSWPSAGVGKVNVQEKAFDAVNNKECISPISTLDVTISPSPTANTINGDFDLCQGLDSFVYQLSGMPGSTYEWSIDGVSKGIIGQGSSSMKTAWPLAGNYLITVIEMSKDSCLGTLIDSLVIVHPNPTTTGIFGEAVLCYPTTKNIRHWVKGFANSTYTWTISGGSMVSNLNDSIIADWPDFGTGFMSVFETTEFGCRADTLELPIYVNRLELDLKVISVGFPDDRMHLNYTTVYDELRTGKYEIQRRLANAGMPWQTIDFETFQNYTDRGLDTDDQIWEYRIRAVDLCGVEQFSDEHTNINLVGAQSEEDFDLFMNFSPYLGWENGVRRYELYVKSNESDNFEYVQDVTPGSTIFIDGNSEQFVRCYRIKAYEEGSNEVSWSNEICFYFSPNVYVPNAFTPNDDELNDKFNPVTVAIKDYSIRILNRWGQEVFISYDKEIDWDGTYKGEEAQIGIYVYYLEFSDFKDKRYQKSGTIQLIR